MTVNFPLDVWWNISRYLSINDLCKCCIVCKEWNEIFSHEVIWRDQVSALLINGYHKHKQDFSKLSFKLQCKKLYEDFYGWKGCWFIQGNQSKKIEPKFFISMNRGLLKEAVHTIKLVIIGDNSVKKANFLITYAQQKYPQHYVPTVFDNCAIQMLTPVGIVELSLWDTTGQEDYERLRPLSYANSSVIFMAYSPHHRNSFENIQSKWWPEYNHYLKGEVPLILISLKQKMVSKKEINPVTTEEGLQLAKRIKAIGYCQCVCSSKYVVGIEKPFEFAVQAVLSPSNEKKQCLIQ